jgi:predicted DNA-binding protein (MmcQ/YjbR family)
MTRLELEKYIAEEYGVMPEYLWEGDSVTGALRHVNTKKWFGIIMRISANKLGLKTEDLVDVINVKLDPDLIQELIVTHSSFIFPAYHMNKKHWLTILLNASADDALIKALINDSYGLTL